MKDFSLTTFKFLLTTLIKSSYTFSPFYKRNTGAPREIILRHDVDLKPQNAVAIAKIEEDLGLAGSFYFRIVPGSFDPAAIRKIASMGHETGYHYEDMNFAWAKLKAQGSGLRAQGEHLERQVADIGIGLFLNNLNDLRKIVPVKTICMHGSPMSRWDSRVLWKYYDYHDFGIIGEPYFDINFDEVLYLTDTGRRWDGDSVNIRDLTTGDRRKTTEKFTASPSFPLTLSASYRFHSTFDIIRAAEEGKLPDKIMMTFHPQRWTDNLLPWIKELLWQNTKNQVKYYIIRRRKNK